jgi:cytochrome c oxidase subunit IV
MTTTTDQTAAHTHHPTPRQYVNIALLLAVLTALEVGTYFFEFGPFAVPMLILLMVVKFLYVAGWFMHLKFDHKFFKQIVTVGLGFALVLYAILAVLSLLDHPL